MILTLKVETSEVKDKKKETYNYTDRMTKQIKENPKYDTKIIL